MRPDLVERVRFKIDMTRINCTDFSHGIRTCTEILINMCWQGSYENDVSCVPQKHVGDRSAEVGLITGAFDLT